MIQIPKLLRKAHYHMREVICIIFEDSIFIFFLNIETVCHLAVTVYRIKYKAIVAAGIKTVGIVFRAMLV